MAKKDTEIARIAKLMHDFAEFEAISQKRILLNWFLRGLMQGLGIVVGGTLLVALLLWILGFFNDIPLLGPLLEKISDSVQSNKL